MAEQIDSLRLQTTADGSVTFFSELFQEAFHSRHGAKQEAEAKFVIPSRMIEKSRSKSKVCILDVCYGLGYNSAAACESLPTTDLEIIALENNLLVPQKAIEQGLLKIWSPSVQAILQDLAKNLVVKVDRLEMQLIIGDARQTIQQVPLQWADAIFLDPFSPPRCPQLWTVDFLQLLAGCLKPDGCLVTYSCSAAVRAAMLEVGWQIASTPPVGRRSPGTIAMFATGDLADRLPDLSIEEQELLQTRAAIPYRDPTLLDPTSAILARRQQEQNSSNLLSGSSWRRRYLTSPEPEMHQKEC